MVVIGVAGLMAVSGLFAAQVGIAADSISPEVSGGPAIQNGADIYYTARDSAGHPIPYQGGMMMRLACANCHGPNGHGRQTMMFVSPNITYANLTNPEGMLEPDGSRMPPYTDRTIQRTITQGIGSDGKTLDWPMPRWQMSGEDLDDLIAFLKTLK
jgi:cytochrome c oxidase subunit 2